jgi:hypothetical protein
VRKNVLAFDYMPLGPLLASLCKSKTICEFFLRTWRARDKWLGKDSTFVSKVIREHFDGNKFQENQAFWDPKVEWKIPVIYLNMNCSHAFKTFLASQRCKEVIKHWDSNIEHYKFACLECLSKIHAMTCMLKVNDFLPIIASFCDG